MKIENYEGNEDTFTFPYNSTTFEDSTDFNSEITTIPFDNKHLVITSGSLNPKNLTITGHFSGSSKNNNYNLLLKKCSSKELKKFYFQDDKFYIVVSPNIKKTHQGGRTNFIDYVGVMNTPIPFIFSSTLKTDNYNGTSWTDGTKTNAGAHKTFIEDIVVTLGTGSSGDTLTIDDNSSNGIKITMPSNYSAGETLKIKLITMVESGGINTTEFWYVTYNGTAIGRSTNSGKNTLDLTLQPDEQINTFTIGGTLTYSDIEFNWRDSYLS